VANHYSHPTTEGLEAVRQFVNTVHYEGEVEEQLDSPASLESFLAEQGFARSRCARRCAT
jgi:hypothetical protein